MGHIARYCEGVRDGMQRKRNRLPCREGLEADRGERNGEVVQRHVDVAKNPRRFREDGDHFMARGLLADVITESKKDNMVTFRCGGCRKRRNCESSKTRRYVTSTMLYGSTAKAQTQPGRTLRHRKLRIQQMLKARSSTRSPDIWHSSSARN